MLVNRCMMCTCVSEYGNMRVTVCVVYVWGWVCACTCHSVCVCCICVCECGHTHVAVCVLCMCVRECVLRLEDNHDYWAPPSRLFEAGSPCCFTLQAGQPYASGDSLVCASSLRTGALDYRCICRDLNSEPHTSAANPLGYLPSPFYLPVGPKGS